MKKQSLAQWIVVGGILSLCCMSANAGTIPASSCASDFSSCSIYEDGSILSLPGLAISGDVILLDPVSGDVSDVFRIFNDVVDTGGGTGLGDQVTLYSDDEGNLPLPSDFSVNAVTMTESSVIVDLVNNLTETDYDGNGTIYQLFSRADAVTPEPSSMMLLGAGALVLGWVGSRRRQVR